MTSVKPRDAATLILVRRDGEHPRILMGQRSKQHSFMPDKWVFPGGRLDRTDYTTPILRDLQQDVAQDLAATTRLSRQNGERLARALAKAAVRETFEETGLIIGKHDGRKLWSDLAGLKYIGRAITPPASPKRFDARFLLADAESLASLDAKDSRELNEVAWFTLKECYNQDLPTVTRAVLQVVEQHLDGRQPEKPFWRWSRRDPNSAI